MKGGKEGGKEGENGGKEESPVSEPVIIISREWREISACDQKTKLDVFCLYLRRGN